MTAERFKNDTRSSCIVKNMITIIQQNVSHLSEIDGAVGDGDHGINMNKGFTRCGEILTDDDTFSTAIEKLGTVLLTEIGGSMGPLYGMFFLALYEESNKADEIGSACFFTMLHNGLEEIQSLGNAQLGDKTLLDTLIPAVEALKKANEEDKSFFVALKNMEIAAKKGYESTEGLIAKVGRASRLGERSRGVLDAGATSCYLLIKSMTESICKMLERESDA